MLFSPIPQNKKTRIRKKCDRCGTITSSKYEDFLRCRIRHNTTQDYCQPCSIQVYITGDNNPAKRQEVAVKISTATKGKSKTFKDGKNPRIIGKKLSTNGYILIYDNKSTKYLHEHRLVMSEVIQRDLRRGEKVHHIDGDKKNNQVENLFLCSSEAQHQILHQQLQSIALELVKRQIIRFDTNAGKYFIDPDANMATLPQSLAFTDVALKQLKDSGESRLDRDTRSEVIRGIYIDIPLIAANMSSVCNAEFCIQLAQLGSMGVLHRAQALNTLLKETKKVAEVCPITCVSVGVGDNVIDEITQLANAGANVIFLDIAHGYTDKAISTGKKIKINFPHLKLVMGNTTNIDMLYEINQFADAIKVGIAQGFACETKNTAGCTDKQFSVAYRFGLIAKTLGIPVISDGSIREPADFTKAIASGCNSVMAGKIFAACPESAAEIVVHNGTKQKKYLGMSSRQVQDQWRGGLKSGICPEGGIRYLEIGESVKSLLTRYQGGLRSGMSYVGAKTIQELQEKAIFIRQTSAGYKESTAHRL